MNALLVLGHSQNLKRMNPGLVAEAAACFDVADAVLDVLYLPDRHEYDEISKE